MTWQEFNETVRSNLPVDDGRKGVQTFIDQRIRAGAFTLQQQIKSLRAVETVELEPGDIDNEGVLGGSVPIEGYGVIIGISLKDEDEDPQELFKLERIPPSKIDAMLEDEPCVVGKWLTYGDRVYFNPRPDIGDKLRIRHLVSRQDFENDEDVAFNEQAAIAVAEYVKSQLSLVVDKDVTLAREHERNWMREKAMLHADAKEAELSG